MPWRQNIEHVVVMMMENRSFDHLLGGFQQIDHECDGAVLSVGSNPRSNELNGKKYVQAPWVFQQDIPSNDSIDLWVPNAGGKQGAFDPMHELKNTEIQLAIKNNIPTMAGFVQDAFDEYKDKVPFNQHMDELLTKVMSYIPFGSSEDNDPLPAIQGLARRFTVCDHWFSSLPGPTWPNRFFAMMGSAHGRVSMPDDWRNLDDFCSGLNTFSKQICQSSIFSQLDEKGVSFQMYSDGQTPLAYMVKGSGSRRDLQQFEQDIKNGDLPAFAWIEPDYGYIGSNNDSQHPPEDIRFGDALIARVFNALTSDSEVWKKTIFVVLYDEHGGFYDHVPPPTTIAPDNISSDVAWRDGSPFKFDRLGVRVPAIIASPWIKRCIDHTSPYDHTSLLAFICDIFDLDRAPLGKRVQQATHFGNAKIWTDQPRQDVLNLELRKVVRRSRDLVIPYETPLATNTRMFVQGMHAYIHGHNVNEALNKVPYEGIVASLPTPQQLEAMADDIRQRLSNSGVTSQKKQALHRALSMPVIQSPSLRVLCLHGVGHGDAMPSEWQSTPDWQDAWREVIKRQLTDDKHSSNQIKIEFLKYDDLFGDGPNLLQISKGVATLLDGLLPIEKHDREFIDLRIPPVDQIVRWTAGMVIQWIEDAKLRDQLYLRLLEKVTAFKPQIVLAHSLGSLISYDCLRRATVAGGPSLDAIHGLNFVSFGSQISHQVLMREIWGGRLMPLHDQAGRGVTKWFNLYNPHDKVFTAAIGAQDGACTDLVTDFSADNEVADMLSLDHSAVSYLDHPVARQRMWPILGQLVQLDSNNVRALAAPTILPRLMSRRQRALLVGINNYPNQAMHLDGCLNDVYLVSRMLQESGYDASDIRLLVDERATRAQIMDRLQWLVEGARDGDERLFFYSGHGAQIPAYGASSEPDHLDETLVPFDFNWDDANTHFTDKQFQQFYSHLPFGHGLHGARFTAIFDCCHAAGMTRGAGRVRGISPPPDIRHRMLRWCGENDEWIGRDYIKSVIEHRAYSNSNNKHVITSNRHRHGISMDRRTANHDSFKRQCQIYGHDGPYMPLLLYAAHEDELASEYTQGASSYGAFTYALIEQIRSGNGSTFQQIIQKSSENLKRRQFYQRPEIVGPEQMRQEVCRWRVR